MKDNRLVSKRLILFLTVLMMAVGNVRIVAGCTGSTFFLTISAAQASGLAPAGETSDDAALQEQYDAAGSLFDAGEYEKAYQAFEALGKFSDSRARAADSKRRWNAARYKEAVALYKAEQYYDAKDIFEALGRYEKSRYYTKECTWRIARLEYQQAKELYAAGDYENAKLLFESLGKYHDSRERAQAAADMIQAQKQAEEERRYYDKALALKEAGDLEGARDALIEAGDCEDATDQFYTILQMLALRDAYETAEGYYHAGDYEAAYGWFLALGDYEDSAEKAGLSQEAWKADVYGRAVSVKGDDADRAYILFLSLGDYRDSAALAESLKTIATAQGVYAAAEALAQEGRYEQAKLGFEAVSGYADSQECIAELSEDIRRQQAYRQAVFLRAIGEEEQANAMFKELGDYHNASDMILPLTPKFTTKQLRDDRTSPQSPVFTAPDGTKHRYQIYKGVHTWVEAKAFCEALGGHLATLTTAEENEFVYRFMRDCGYLTAYFGLSDEARKGDWIWVTGEPFDYTNWHRGEPSRSGRERYGMYFYKHTDGTWNDSHFYEDAEVDPGCSYICEWDE